MIIWLVRHRNAVLWAMAVLAFAAGFYVGWSINAKVGAGLWLASAVLAFLPFLSHRNLGQMPPQPQDHR